MPIDDCSMTAAVVAVGDFELAAELIVMDLDASDAVAFGLDEASSSWINDFIFFYLFFRPQTNLLFSSFLKFLIKFLVQILSISTHKSVVIHLNVMILW